jgi:hypothetical protein
LSLFADLAVEEVLGAREQTGSLQQAVEARS